MLLPAQASLRELMTQQLGFGHGCDVLSCVPGILWNVVGFAEVTLVLLQDCFTKEECGHGEPEEVLALRSAGRRVSFAWHPRARGEPENRWDKLRLVLLTAQREVPALQFVLKLDSDTVLFPERLLSFLSTLASAAGAEQPLYFGSHEGASDNFMQGHFYGLNGLALQYVLANWSAADGLAVHDAINEDLLMGRVAQVAGVFFVHCGHFIRCAATQDPQHCAQLLTTAPALLLPFALTLIRSYAPAYVKPAGSTVYPLPTNPISLHKLHKLSLRRKGQVPARLCVGLGWNCRNETASYLRLRLEQLF